jgi:hypothetical protein
MSAGAGVTVPSVVKFVSRFYTGGHVGGLSKLCHKCVMYIEL